MRVLATVRPTVVDFETLTDLYDAKDAGDLVAGRIYRVRWSNDVHVADGEIVTQWTGAKFHPDPMTQGVEFPGYLFEPSDWTHNGPTGSFSQDAKGRPQFIQDQTTIGTGGIFLDTRYLAPITSARFRVRFDGLNNNAPAFNRNGPCLLGAGNSFDPFVPEYILGGAFEDNQLTAVMRLLGGSLAETNVGIGRNFVSLEHAVINLIIAYEVNSIRAGLSWGLADATKTSGIESPAQALDYLEAGLPYVRPGLMSLTVNTGSGTTTATLLGVELQGNTVDETDPRTY